MLIIWPEISVFSDIANHCFFQQITRAFRKAAMSSETIKQFIKKPVIADL